MRLVRFLLPLLFTGVLHAQSPAFTSSDVADAAERLTGSRAHMSREIRLLSGAGLAGPAITLRVLRDDTASSMTEGLKAIKVVETAPPGSVIVLALEGEKDFAVFGATFATLAQSRNLGGFVVDGSMRGLSDFRRLGFPMFARGAVPGSAGGHYRLEATNVPVMCGGVEVAPGDFVVGDADGVAVAPKEHYEKVLAEARRLREEKEALLPLVERHKSYTQAVQKQKVKQEQNPPPQP